jgi:hypothetical protein
MTIAARYRIESAARKWMAPQQPPKHHRAAADRTMIRYRFGGVFRAARHEAAGWRQ